MSNKYSMNKLAKKAGNIIFLLLFSVAIVRAQTVLVSPTAEGGFELGTGSFADNGWTVVNAPTNKWYTGTGLTSGSYSFPTTSRCAYISNNSGTSWAYGASTNEATHFYRDVVFPAGQTIATLTFKFQQNGNNARLLVHLCDSNLTPVVGQPNSGSVAVTAGSWGTGNLVLLTNTVSGQAAGTVTYKVSLPPSLLGNCNVARKRRIVFTWNSSTSATNPPAAVDEISVVSSAPVSPVAGTFTINNTQPTSGTNFNSFTDAINWANAAAYCGINNPVTINVTAGQTFAENLPMLTASGTAANPIIFQRSGAGANPQIRPDGNGPSYAQNIGTVDYGFCLMGTDYVTIDGIDINPMNGNVEYGYFVGIASATNGSAFNTIKNCSIRLDRTNTATKGILQSASNISALGNGINLFSASSIAGTNRNNKYQNITISNSYSGVILYGASETLADEYNTVGTTADGIFNIIGSESVAGDIGNGTAAGFGIYGLYQKNITLHNNKISNVSSTATVDGIVLGAPSSTYGGVSGFENRVYNNIITNITNTSTTSTSTVTGIRIMHETTLGLVKVRVYNNVINKIRSAYTGTPVATRAVKGLHLPTTTAANTAVYEIVNNTIIIDASTFPGLSSIAFEAATNQATFVLRNNLFVNKTGAQTGAAIHYVLGVATVSTTLGAAGTVSNYNDFYLANATNGSLGLNGLTALTNWKSNYSTDANSLSADPLLNSEDVLYPLYTSPLVAACPSLSTPYDRDVLGNKRNATQSTIGAFERTGDVIPPVIKDTTLLGITSTGNRVLNGLLSITDGGSMVATTLGSAPRIYFKKSTDANVFGPNQSSANGWKWVEATTLTSPFGFTIDYSLLRSAVAVHDVIEYFFVAQDTVGTPNVAALPSAGFAGTSVSNITSAPAVVKYYIIYDPAGAFTSATVAQGTTAKVITGEVNQQIIRMAVQTATGDSGYVTALTLNSAGTNDRNNISNVKIWYTGTSPAFATTKQFGTTLNVTAGSGALGNVTINGAQIIAPNATSYFWLTYDMRTTGVVYDSVDAEALSVIYDGTLQPFVVTTVPGSRVIKSAYCVPASTGTYEITNVKLNTLNNTTTATTTPYYTNYTPAVTTTTSLKKGLRYTLSVTGNNSSGGVVVYIDYNDDGVFDDPSERILVTPQGLANTANTIPVIIPCNAMASSAIRMRVRSFYYSNNTLGCSTAQPGEVEDYTIAIQDYAPAYVSSSVSQLSGTAAPAATNKVIASVPVVAEGCGIATLGAVYCNTNITNNTSAIVSAKLYTTGTAKVFNPSKLVATSFSPSGSFIFNSLTDTVSLSPGDTNYYWITYDVAPGAALNDTLDIRIDSIFVAGNHYVPAGNNPAEYQLVKPVNTYSSSSVIHPVLARTPKIGQANSPVLRVRIITSNTGAPKQLTSLSLTTSGGGNDTMNIAKAKVFYTGNSASFNSATLFGTYENTAPVTAAWPAYVVTGSQYLLSDTNYFWVAYDIKATAAVNDSVDAELTSFVLDGSTVTPTSSALAGNFKLTPQYCASTYVGLSSPSNYLEELLNVSFGTLNNSTTCAQTGGNNSVLNIYSDYTELIQAPNIAINEPVAFSFSGRAACIGTTASNQTVFKAYIDYNSDGDFTDAGEEVYASASAAGSLTVTRTVTGTIVVPCSAKLGLTRMRVIYAGANAPTPASCGTAGWYGETEDYTINIVATPVYYATAKTSQVSAMVAPGTTDVSTMRVGVKISGCGSAGINALYFHTSGTAAAGSIAAAKLYSTGKTGTFTNPTLLNTVTSPNGAFAFTGLGITTTDNAPTDTNYFWLVYDVSGTATVGTTIDAVLDSVSALGMQTVSAPNGNPTGELAVTAKMAFISSQTTHPDLSSVAMGTKNRAIVRVLVRGTTGGATVVVSALGFSTNGGINDLTNIDSARVYYTGESPVFATTTRFGNAYAGTTNPWGAFTINGNQVITGDSAYFWLTYDIKSTATLYDSVDAEFTSVTYDGIAQPATGAPAGSIGIKYDYCAAQGYGVSTNILNITNVTTGGINNTTTCALANKYGNFTALAPANLLKGSATSFSLSAVACGFLPIQSAFVNVYIDLDQNGLFGTDELILSSPGFDIFTGLSASLNIPCNAKTGLTRMRVIANVAAINSPCGTATTQSEVEDYSVNIINNAIVYQGAVAAQETGTVAQGGVNQQVMNLKVKASGCGIAELTDLYLNTASTASPASNILSAKLYATGTGKTFNTTKLLATVFAPGGAFVFHFRDTLLPDSNNYWVAYDIASGATNGAVIDVAVDSMRIAGSSYIPTNNNPSAFKTVQAPLFFNSVQIEQGTSDRVALGSNAIISQVKIITSGPGAPIRLTSFNLETTGGGLDTANIAAAKLYYTGNTNVFATTNQFGASYTPLQAATSAGKWLPYTITGNQALLADTNYFWLVYQLKATAVTGDSVDAVLNGIVIEGTPFTPALTSPAGNAIIRKDYCIPGIVSARCIDTVEIGTIRNYSGVNCASPYYTLYPNAGSTRTDVYVGSSLPIRLTFASATKASVFIDLNRNGGFELGEEFNLTGNVSLASVITSIAIPSYASLGETRLRIRSFGGQSTGVVTNKACDDWNQSETEDYIINILPALPQGTYVWNKSAAADFMVDTNWTPARVGASPGDRLVFGGNAGAISVYNVPNQTVKAIEVAGNTTLQLTAPVANTLTASDSLIMGSDVLISAGTNLTLEVGVSTGIPGIITKGFNSGIKAKVKRWITGSGSVEYPIVNAKGSKAVTISYQSAPVPGSLTVSYENAPAGGSGGFPLYESGAGIYINKATPEGYWDLVAGDGLAGGLYTAAFRADSLSNLFNTIYLVLINRENAFSNWMLNGTHVFTTGTAQQPELSRNAVYGYGQFAVGSDSMLNPLPVSLLSFNGANRLGTVQLKWATASEKNNAGFDVQRSADGRTFQTIGFVKGAGRSNTVLGYDYADQGAFVSTGRNALYYRLKQKDADGAFTYSNTIMVVEENRVMRSVSVYPNPASEQVNVLLSAAQSSTVQLTLLDMSGRKVLSKQVSVNEGENLVTISGTAELQQGVYFLRIESDGMVLTEKIVKQ